MKRYYTIDMDAIKHFDLSLMEWMILENIHFMCAETGWCYATKKSLCEHHDISTQMYRRYTVKLTEDGWLKSNKKGDLKTTKKYLEIVKQKFQSEEKGVKQKFHSDRNKSFNESETKVSSSSIKTDIKRENKDIIKEAILIPEWIDLETWNNWVQFRKEIKKPLTPSAIKQQLKFLEENKADHKQIIEQSIRSGYQGLFPIRGNSKTQKGKFDSNTNIDLKRFGLGA